MTYVWPNKDPDEILDYKHDWSARLDGDTIATVDVIFETSIGSNTTVLERPTAFASTIQTVWLEGGQVDDEVKLTLRITTVGGRTYDEGVKLKIKER